MSLVFADRVRETTRTTGTGALVLVGTSTGYQSFAAVGNGNTCYYCVTGNGQWEVGTGTYDSAAKTLTRTPSASSNGGFVVVLASGPKDVFITIPANYITAVAHTNVSQTFTGDQTINGALNVFGSADDITGNILSGSATKFAALNIGRLVADAVFGIAGVVDQFFTGSTSGDLGIRSAGFDIRLGTDATGVTTQMILTAGGNVGIGTTTPNTALVVNGNSGFGQLNLKNYANTTNDAGFGVVGSSNQIINGDVAGDLSIYTSAGKINFSADSGTTDHLVILNSGNVGIGTTAPDGKLCVLNDSATNVPVFERTSTSTTTFGTAAIFKTTTTANMADTFAAGIKFAIEDSAAVENYIGFIGAERSGGSDSRGDILLMPYSGGLLTDGLRITGSNNVGIGPATFGTSATRTLSIATGTAPSTGPADTVQLYSSDNSAGNTIPSFFCEGTDVLATGQADSASSVRVKMRINGTVVTLLGI